MGKPFGKRFKASSYESRSSVGKVTIFKDRFFFTEVALQDRSCSNLHSNQIPTEDVSEPLLLFVADGVRPACPAVGPQFLLLVLGQFERVVTVIPLADVWMLADVTLQGWDLHWSHQRDQQSSADHGLQYRPGIIYNPQLGSQIPLSH